MGFSEVANNPLPPPPPRPPQAAAAPAPPANGGVQPVPIPQRTSSPSNNFTFSPNSQLGQKDDSSSLNAATSVPNNINTISAPGPSPGPSPVPVSSSSMTTLSAASNVSQVSTSISGASSVALHSVLPSVSMTPGLPGQAAATVQPSSLSVSSAVVGSFSPAGIRPVVPAAPLPSHPSVQPQLYPPYGTIPTAGSSPQPLWLQPQQLGGLRPPFLPYPPPYPGSFGFTARGLSLPSVPLPDAQPPGITPVVNTGSVRPSSSVPLVQSSVMQSEVAPPGTDNKTADVAVGVNTLQNDQSDAWSAHKSETGAVYYYNAVTGESTYEKPSGFKGEPEKATTQPTPVSWEKVGGTDWALVTTNDGKKYYYNTKTETSSWQVPPEVTELRKKQDSDSLKENLVSVPNSSALNDKGAGASTSLSAPALSTGGRDAIALRASGVPGSSALDLVKKKLHESGAQVTSFSTNASSGSALLEVNGSKTVEPTAKGLQNEGSKDKPKVADGDGNGSDSSSDSEDEDSGPTKEERIAQFKVMLKERGVAPFSKWDKELPKIVFDPRFKAIPTYAERRSLFDHYVRTRAEEERKERRAAQKAALEGFKQLLEEAKEDIDHSTDYYAFRKRWGHDPRFEALERKDRETLLNERVLSLKRATEEKMQAERAIAVANFKAMLQERGDINASSRWSRVKDGFRDDNRYKAVNHEEREAVFNEYISELKAADDEVERKAKAKKDEQEKLKERERELRKRKEREEQEMERVRIKVRRKEAVSSYQALLVETIKNPQASWTESKFKIEKDPQGRASNPDLDESDLEKLFREHVKMLYERCAQDFRALLVEVITPEAATRETEDGKTVLSSWSTAKRSLKSDPRYAKVPRKDREIIWKRHVEDLQRKQKVGAEHKGDKYNESKSRNSNDYARSSSASRSGQDRR